MPDEDLLDVVVAPDFPTGGIIYGRKGIRDAYLGGHGRIIVRAKANIETQKNGKEKQDPAEHKKSDPLEVRACLTHSYVSMSFITTYA